MRTVVLLMAAIILLTMHVAARSDVFNLGPGLTNLETVTVGDPGNVGELSGNAAGGYGPDRICGAVSYTYNIGKYEVTAAQYCDFLNHKAKSDPYDLYSTHMSDLSFTWQGCNIIRTGSSGSYSYSVAADWTNRPVNYVSFWDACRFANWLNNGQGDGDTETGTYTLNAGLTARAIQRNPGSVWAVASEDEWYKAAYYRGGGTNAGYWDYATQSNAPPSNQLVEPVDPGNNATYVAYYNSGYTIGGPYYRTEVGAHENSESAYGTFDQCGNVWELNDTVAFDIGSASRVMRGGSFDDYGNLGRLTTSASYRYYGGSELASLGFRVSQVPEPSSLLAIAVGGAGVLLCLRRRRASS